MGRESDNNKKLNILFLTPRFVYPLIGGDRVKPFYLLSHLAKKHNVTLVSFFQGQDLPKSYIKTVQDLGLDLHYVVLNPVKAGANVLPRLLSKMPLEISYYYQPEYRKLANNLMKERDFDLGISFFMRTAEYIKKAKFKKILIAEDCRTVYQYRSYKESTDLKQRFIRWWEYKKLRKYEPHIVNFFDKTTLVSGEDVEGMKNLNSKADFSLLTNGVDIEAYKPPENQEARKGILFAGKLDVWANELTLRTIINDLMPIIRNEIEDIELFVVGAKPTTGIKEMAKKHSFVKLYPDVPEMQPFLQSAQLFLHPHAGGSGIQNKLLEAMSCGCPVVTTPTGNQGIYGTHRENIMIGETIEDLGADTLEVLKDKELAEKLSINGRDWIVKTHSWDAVYNTVDDIINDVMFEDNISK